MLKRGRVIEVHEVLVADPDDPATPKDLNYHGTLVLTSSLGPGCKIQAGGDVFINGNIDGSQVQCGGSLFLTGWIKGGHQSIIQTGNHLVTRFCTHAQVGAGGNVEVETSILRSRIQCEGNLILRTGKGIVGGKILVSGGIDTTSIGSGLGILTNVYLGKYAQAQFEMPELLRKKKSNFENLRKTSIALKSIRSLSPAELTRDKVLTAKKLKSLLSSLRTRDQEYTRRMYDLNKDLDERAIANLVVRQTVNTEVSIQMGKAVLEKFDNPIQSAVMRLNPDSRAIDISPILEEPEI